MNTSVELVEEAAKRTLKASDRIQHRGTDAIIRALAQTARDWLKPDSVWRKRASKEAPAVTGFSKEMVYEAVDLTFGAITEESLRELLEGLRKEVAEPRLTAHFLAGNVPPPGIASICVGLLLKSANLVKLSSRDPVFPTLFVESLRQVDPELAGCIAVFDWRREEIALTQAALAEADAVVAYGDDDTIESLRRMCQPKAHFLGYGHKLSFAMVAREALTKTNLPQLVEAAAFDASVYDQQGCLSPHAFYVEESGEVSPREFAAALAKAMAAYQARVPRGRLTVEEAAQIAKLRGAYEFRSATDTNVLIWASSVGLCACENDGAGETAQAGTPMLPTNWLVVFEEDPMFTASCLNRVIFVKPIRQLESVLQLMQRFASNLSTVGVAPMNEHTTAFAKELAKVGVNRVCPLGQMQRPPLSWQLDR
ncbi:MAG TPA: acyl-CoA reductase [Verrucomicrobiae bacterium]|nr:acyl-CoA reductase [Verrucomicrobiae bacterium]